MTEWLQRIKLQFGKNHLLSYGLPFISVVVLGPFLLRYFGEVRYKYRKVKQVPEEELKSMGFKPTEQITLEDEYKKVKEMDIENWEQKRGPRPWEETFDEPKK
ncbi:cytochrome c oxidase assembly protein COX16 homolog, mitochondrial [Sitodiplosis mosellana]|uniref:cytochrome c oxidase assembly protein COX16 homolog, mitochondrial n=1 Tax=Sitodiplosis mosellana TaxID=263140 RepID=UPI00244511AA|nr:cytochrome c oxidase assembly protein COX16 homolog, mitochondrial [Sitodiplosis mosellana]